MTPEIIPGPSYYCEPCNQWYEGEPISERAFDPDDLDSDEYYTLEEAWENSKMWRYSCPQGHQYHQYDDDGGFEIIFQVHEGNLYRCSHCQTVYGDMAHGLQCCVTRKRRAKVS